MAGRFNSKFKKRTSHNTSNIRTQSSPTVSKSPPPRKTVSKPTPVRNTPRGSTLTSNVVNTLSHNPFTIQEATAQESYDTNVAAADEGTKFQDVSKMSLYDKDDPTQIHPENEWSILNPTTWFGSGTSPSTYNIVIFLTRPVILLDPAMDGAPVDHLPPLLHSFPPRCTLRVYKVIVG